MAAHVGCSTRSIQNQIVSPLAHLGGNGESQPEFSCLPEPSQPANDGSHRRPGTFLALLPTLRVTAGSLRRPVDRREPGWDSARLTTSQWLQSELRGHRTMSWDECV